MSKWSHLSTTDERWMSNGNIATGRQMHVPASMIVIERDVSEEAKQFIKDRTVDGLNDVRNRLLNWNWKQLEAWESDHDVDKHDITRLGRRVGPLYEAESHIIDAIMVGPAVSVSVEIDHWPDDKRGFVASTEGEGDGR